MWSAFSVFTTIWEKILAIFVRVAFDIVANKSKTIFKRLKCDESYEK